MKPFRQAVAVGICVFLVSGIGSGRTEYGRAAQAGGPGGIVIDLQPVLAGLIQPVFVTGAGDGSGRLFIVEQAGTIKVLRSGEQAATDFLDISAKVLSGGEQGLLGLAFHPQFARNRRFFVNYTRQPDGATVVAEYRAGAANPDVADPEESVVLEFAQPFANHNGGMVAFGPDGFLYIATGDGGAGNDPQNRAQNPQNLLGKILRIDVDHSGASAPYSIPASNPFSDARIGRPEIFALGLRNPWRFSFDRVTGRLYAGDVGQGQIEEVDIIKTGGNYGWRVFEGSACTGLGPAPCFSPGFLPPVTEYHHSLGRCSITGGYVYRGSRSSLPYGGYIFADFCTGEIFLLDSGVQSLLLSTGRNISSFGEGEDGELYVVDWGGNVFRIINPGAPVRPSLYIPRLAAVAGRPSGQDEWLGLAAANVEAAPLTLTFHAYDRDGRLIQGAGIINPATLDLAGGQQAALLDSQIFGEGFRSQDREGWIRVESDGAPPDALCFSFDGRLASLDGARASPILSTNLVFPQLDAGGSTRFYVANPNDTAVDLRLELVAADGATRAAVTRTLQPNQLQAETAAALFPGEDLLGSEYLRASAGRGVAAFEYLGGPGQDARGLNGQDATSGALVLYAPQFVFGGAYRSYLSVVNLEAEPGTVTVQLFGDDGRPVSGTRTQSIAGKGKLLVSDPAFFGDSGPLLTQGYLEIRSSGPLLTGSVTIAGGAGLTFAADFPLVTMSGARQVFEQVTSNAAFFTGVAIVNPGADAAIARVEVFNQNGLLMAQGDFAVPAGGRISGLLTELFPSLAGQSVISGYIGITADRPIAGLATFGTSDLTALSAIPAQPRR